MTELVPETPETEAVPLWKRITGVLGMLSGAGSWLSLLAAGVAWVISGIFLFLLIMGLDGQFDYLIPSMPHTKNFVEGIIVGFFFLIALFIGFVVVFMVMVAGVVLPALLAVALHFIGVVTSVGTIAAPGNHWAARLAGVPPLLIHIWPVLGFFVLCVVFVISLVYEELTAPDEPIDAPIEEVEPLEPEPVDEPADEPEEPVGEPG